MNRHVNERSFKTDQNTTITRKINFKIMCGNVDCLMQVFGWVGNGQAKKKKQIQINDMAGKFKNDQVSKS